ncbi:MAG: glycosyltransferase [Tannerellaceae bacterium]|jgi:glycosyltransferase|nr:glycosyltransferase [Tannerellaceae bacterium]
MKNIFIINQQSKSTNYGIGTYTRQLTEVFRKLPVCLYIINVGGAGEVSKEEKDGVCYINIPRSRQTLDPFNKNYDRYLRNVYYTIRLNVRIEDDNTFFFNHMNLSRLGELLKKNIKCRIILIVHYMDWSFTLLGDIKKMKEIIKQPSNSMEESIVRAFESERQCMRDVADHIIAIAKHSYKTVRTLYKIPAEKITLIPNGLKDVYRKRSKKEKAEIRKKYYIQNKEKILIFSGRLDPVKGVSLLIESFKIILEENSDIKLFIVGDGSLNLSLGEANPCWSRIIFTGYLPQEQLFELYSIADIGIVTSLHEEFGYVAIEMMMQGLPVVANKTTGLKETINDKINGLLIKISTNEELKKASLKKMNKLIVELLYDPLKCEKYSKEGRKIFLEKYCIHVFNENIIELYNNILNNNYYIR